MLILFKKTEAMPEITNLHHNLLLVSILSKILTGMILYLLPPAISLYLSIADLSEISEIVPQTSNARLNSKVSALQL